MNALRADSPLQYIRGVGPRLAEAFASLGLHTVSDLLEYFPFRYEQEFGETEIADLRPGLTATIRGEVTHARRDYPNYRCLIEDGTGGCTLRWFNQPYSGRGLSLGATVIATGQVREYNGELEMVQPSVQSFAGDTVLLARKPGTRRVGVYSGNQRIKSPSIRRAVRNILAQPVLPVEDVLPAALRKKHALPAREAAIRQMHAPDSDPLLEKARTRLAYEEFLLMELAMALRRRKRVALQIGRKLHVTAEIDKRIRTRFPFPLTPAQDKVVKEIARDLQSGRPMTRLLQGDVGSGKTVVALYACLAAIANGRQAAIMAPTEILAQQHFTNIEKYLEGSRVRRVLLRGGMSRSKRSESLAAIESGALDLIVGTQALLESDVAFKDLALVVVDEQHKFGVLQRAGFRTKGPMPHYLVMTATPIPRTLAMTVFGDLDVSIIDASPPGRGKIITKVVTRRQWDIVMSYVRKRLEAGEQAYVVCPQIGEDGGQSPSAGVPGGQSPSAGSRPHAKPVDSMYRRKLPHMQVDRRAQFITFCTQDRWVLPESVRGVVLAHCLFDHGTRVHVHAVVVMPDHVHLVLTPMEDERGRPYGLAEIMGGIKGASSHTVNRAINRKGRVWQAESFDRIVRCDESLIEKADYVLANPVRKRIVRHELEYAWRWQDSDPIPESVNALRRELEQRRLARENTRPINEASQPRATGLQHQPGATGLQALSVRSVFERLTAGPWRGLNFSLLHGGMKTAEKDAIIGDFTAGKLHAVVSTTVVEVGVDVANATIMIVEHADRFGLSQLHQLRGRVGRGSKDSLCVLIAYEGGMRAATSNPKSNPGAPGQNPKSAGPRFAAPRGKAAERLSVLAETTDGFKIAEADLRQRGPGQLFGTRQHGLPELRFGSIVDDFELLEKARRDAFDIVARDPTLARPEHAAMLPSLRKTFGDKLALIDAG